MIKKIIITISALLSLATSALAEIQEINGLYYYLRSNATAELTGRPDGQQYAIKDVVIPDSVEYQSKKYHVYRISYPAFYENKTIRFIKITGKKIKLGDRAFANSTLKDITFPSEEVYIQIDCFAGCENLCDSMVFNSAYSEFEFHEKPFKVKKVIFKGDSFFHESATAAPNKDSDECKPIQSGAIVPLSSRDWWVDYYKPTCTEIDWGEGHHRIIDGGMPWFVGEHLILSPRVELVGTGWGIEAIKLKTVELPVCDTDESAKGCLWGKRVFWNCEHLQTIICHDPTPWKADGFEFDRAGQIDEITLYVPREAIDTYRNHPAWGQFKNIEAIESGVTSIEADASATPQPEYFDLTGRKVDNPTPGSMLIRRTGSKVDKIIYK